MNHAWIQFLPSALRSKLDGRLTLQQIISNTSWLLADRVLRMGVGLVVGVWVARYLGPAQFGLFNYAIALVSLVTPFATLGLDGIVVRDLVRDPSCREQTLGTTFALKLLGAGLTCCAVLVAIVQLRPDNSLDHWLVGIIAAGMLFQALDTIDFWFQSQVRSKYTVYARNLAFVLVAIVRVVLIHQQAPLIAFAWAGLAETACSAIGLTIVYWATGNRLQHWQVSLTRARSLLADSWPLILSGLAIMVYMKIDQFMLGEMAGNEAVGIYAAATKISEVWYFIPTAIVSSVAPSIIEAKTIGERLYYQRLQRLFDLMVRLSLAIALPVTLIANPLVTHLFGSYYAAAGNVLSLHIWASVFVFLGVAQGPWDLNEGLQRLALIKVAAGGLLNVGLNLWLIPAYGPFGAALATVISYILPNYVANLLNRRTRIIFRLQSQALFFFWRQTNRESLI